MTSFKYLEQLHQILVPNLRFSKGFLVSEALVKLKPVLRRTIPTDRMETDLLSCHNHLSVCCEMQDFELSCY